MSTNHIAKKKIAKNISRSNFEERAGNHRLADITGRALLPCRISWGPGSGATCCSERSVWLPGLWCPYTSRHPQSLWYCCTGLWLSELWTQIHRGGRWGRREGEKQEKVLVWQPFSCKCGSIVVPERRTEIRHETRASHLASCDT